MPIADELFEIADRMEEKARALGEDESNKSLQLIDAAESIGRAWSGSWLGYHSRVYYADFADPPPGARFSKEWGMMDTFAIRDTVGDWREYRFDDVIELIRHTAGNPDTAEQEKLSKAVAKAFDEAQSNTLSLLSNALKARSDDKFLNDLLSKIEKLKLYAANDFIEVCAQAAK